MKVSKREFYWACSKFIPEILEAKKGGIYFTVPDMVKCFSLSYIASKLNIPNDQVWISTLAADTVSVIANELKVNGCFSFSEVDSFCWDILSNKEQSEFISKYGEIL